MTVQPESKLTCPVCGQAETLLMPTDACLFFHRCDSCQSLLRPHPGDCCVFCSYGDRPCPPSSAGTLPNDNPARRRS